MFSEMKLSCRIYRLNLNLSIPITTPGTMLEIVIIGYNEQHARNLAAAHHGTEGPNFWINRLLTDCVLIGYPTNNYSQPQVLAKYVQTPYRDEALCEMDDGAGGVATV